MKILNTWFSLGSAEAVGLDIGTGSVKLVALKQNNGQLTVSSAAYAAIDSSEDTAVCEENTVIAIQKCLAAAGSAVSRNVICGISGQSVSVRGFEFPPMPDEAMEQAIKLEAQQTCALEITNSVVDYQLLRDSTVPSGKNQKPAQKGYFIAGLREAIDKKLRMTQQAQAKTVLMDADCLAILNCISLLPENQTTDIFAAMDIGHNSTTIAILGSNGVPFVRTLAVSGRKIIAAISAKMNVSAGEIHNNLLSETSTQNSWLDTELQSAAAKMISDTAETLRFYSLQHNSCKISRLYLCGGFSLYKPFVRLIQQHLPAACEVFDPLSVLQCPDKDEIKSVLNQFGPAMTVAAGLAMRSINHVRN